MKRQREIRTTTVLHTMLKSLDSIHMQEGNTWNFKLKSQKEHFSDSEIILAEKEEGAQIKLSLSKSRVSFVHMKFRRSMIHTTLNASRHIKVLAHDNYSSSNTDCSSLPDSSYSTLILVLFVPQQS